MKTEVKTKVVAALRSGKYPQDRTFNASLRTSGDCYCVMGVVADVLEPESWRLHESGHCYYHRDRTTDLGQGLRAAAGLTHEEMWSLIRLNDATKTFAELADHIETNL